MNDVSRVNQRPQLAAGDWLSAGARRFGDSPFLVGADGKTQSYLETNSRVNRLAQAMIQKGLGKGSRVGILATDTPQHVEVVLACLKTGAIFCDLNYRLKAPELKRILGTAKCQAIFTESRYLPLLTDVFSVDSIVQIWTIGKQDLQDGASIEILINETLEGSDFTALAVGEDIVSIAFTSGTTGIPKGVLQSERMIRNIIYSGIREMNMREGAFRYAGAPLFHISGIGSVLYSLASGGSILILPQFDAAIVLEWLQNRGLTDCTLIPTMISALLDLPTVMDSKYSDLRSILYGGAPMTPALLKRTISVFGCDLYNGFGAGTEAGGQTMLYPQDHVDALNGKEHLLGSIGKPIMGVDLRICDNDLNELPRGQIGEIVTRSETIMAGYLDQPELTSFSILNGWFRAGDMARMDDEGYLFLTARKADMIIRGGENVYPFEIETTIAEHPAIAGVAVVGIPDAHWGEIVGAAIMLRPEATVDVDEIRDFCRQRLASYKTPEVIRIFDHLPLNPTGKNDKQAIAELMK